MTGRLVIESSPRFRAALMKAIGKATSAVLVIDLSALSYLDTLGVATLLEGARVASAQGAFACDRSHWRTEDAGEIAELDAIFRAYGPTSSARDACGHWTRGDLLGNRRQHDDLQLWRSLLRLPAALPIVGKRRRWRTAVSQMMAIGVSALPVVALMSFCLGWWRRSLKRSVEGPRPLRPCTEKAGRGDLRS